jgi:hypothetical protein
MHFQSEFYLHIVSGAAGEAGPLLARLALNAGYDPVAFPFRLEDLRLVGHFERALGTQGLNEFFSSECARATILRTFEPWNEAHAAQLKLVAASALGPTLDERYPFSWNAPQLPGALA